jgi:kinesin family protein C1
MVGTANNGRSRQAFSVVNGGQDLCPNSAPASNAGSECGGIEFTREDVEALLNEKPKRKDRFNLKVSGFSNILRLLSSKNVSFFF